MPIDYGAYIQNNPSLLQAFSGLRPQDMRYLTNQGYDLDSNGSISQPEYGQFHWQMYGQNENRPYTPTGPRTETGGSSGMPYGSTSQLINPNMAPPSNFWEGDKFVIGAPGMQAGSQQGPQATPQPSGQMPAPMPSRTPSAGAPVGSSMPSSFAGTAGAGVSPAMSGGANLAGQITPQLNLQGIGRSPFMRGLIGSS